MEIPLSEAKAKLTDLVRQVEAGEEVILTRHGKPVARIAPAGSRSRLTPQDELQVLHDIMEIGRAMVIAGPSAARSQDFLYDEYGLPK
ncbi:MAG: type II toxin-antitoxin system prevent-host-death family antitoxin [Hyphomicrobiaceae bacterium]|nr:type II toxin-antitoxin system prevent-host-death family antitoxin [Hyphomicrobiaceae bacterium]